MNSIKQIANIPIIQGERGKFYIYQGFRYDIHFPISWAMEHWPLNDCHLSGPEECENCRIYGSFNGVFVGYCSNCLRMYEDKRGNHEICRGAAIYQMNDVELALRYPYMARVSLTQIGDRHYNDATAYNDGCAVDKATCEPPINSLYLPHVDKNITPQFIAYIFDKLLIATVKKVAFESRGPTTNRAFVEIKQWHDTLTAFSFIQRLRNEERETRVVYADEDWWLVEINKYPHKLHPTKKRTLTHFYCDDDAFDCFYRIDSLGKDFYDREQDARDIESYLNEIHNERNFE
jgi:hypothetical protein